MTAADHAAYLAHLPEAQGAALNTLRAQVTTALPGDAREVMSYGIPAWRAGPGRGKVIVGYAAMKAHLGFYAFDGDVIGRFADRLGGWASAKSTIRFTPDTPLPDDLVRDIVIARLRAAGL